MADPPRALILTHEPPLPAISGGRVRDWNLMRQLASRGWRLALFSLSAGEAPDDAHLAALREVSPEVRIEPFDHRGPGNRLRVGLGIAARRPFQRGYFYSAAARRGLEGLLDRDRFDLILASQLYMYPYVPEALRPVTVLDCHNSELRRVESMAGAPLRSARAVAARAQLGPVARYEREAAAAVAQVLAVSEPEQRYFEQLAPGRVTVIPNGVDCERTQARSGLPASPEILFLGSLDYSANADALRFLAAAILPRLRTPEATVTVVGGGAGGGLLAAARAAPLPVGFAGRVEDTTPYLERARLMIAPLRFGGGTRLKILEALAHGVPVLSTSLGCEGLGLEHERDVIVADDDASLSEWTDRLLADDELCARLAANGRATVERRFDWRAIGARLDELMRRLAAAP